MALLDLFTWPVLVVTLLCGLVALWCYLKLKRGVCTSSTDMSGKTVIITGANTGIGYYTALDLATRNARVILACRNLKKGRQAATRIQDITGSKQVLAKELDVSSLASVRKFVEEILQEEARLDVLINNAGVTGYPSKKTADGFEYMCATNYLGPFLLTNLLLGLLKKSAPSRIVNLSSIAYKYGSIDFDNVCGEKGFSHKLYSDTKLAVILFTRSLAQKLDGTGVTANCVHPGTSNSDLFRYLPVIIRAILAMLGYFFFKTAEEGSQTSVYCAVSRDVEGVTSQYFSDCHVTSVSQKAKDDAVAKKLWDVSMKITGLTKQ